jgi:hypothetical protein
LISIQTFGESFGGLASYLETGESRIDPAQRVGWMEFQNLPTERMDVAVPIMRGTASLSGTQQPVFHFSISWAPGEPVNRELMHAVMVQTLSDLGLREHQAVIVEHIDTDHPHVHAMVNRVHPETGVAWKGSWSKLRAEASLRRQELERGLRVVPGWLAPVPGAPELRPQPRLARGDEEFLREVQDCAGPVLARAQSWSELEAGLSEFGLSVRVNGRGMSVTDGRREVKASQVGREFSRGKLEKRMGRYSDYSARVAVASAEIVRSQAPAPGNRELPNDVAHHPERRVEGGLHPRFSVYEDGGRFGVWDRVGPQIFFAETREQAVVEVERANKIVARYPNIVTVRGLAAMDAGYREEHGLETIPAPGRSWVEMPSPGAPSSPAAAPDSSNNLDAVRGEAAAPESAHQLSFVPTIQADAPAWAPARRQRRTRKTDAPVSASQDDLWSQEPSPAEAPAIAEPEVHRNSETLTPEPDAADGVLRIDDAPASTRSQEVVSTPVTEEPAVPTARPRQRKPRQSRTRSGSEAQADLWSQAPAPDQTAPDPTPGQRQAVPPRVTRVSWDPSEGVAPAASTTPAPGEPLPLEPVAAPGPPRFPEQQVDGGLAHIEPPRQPSVADRYAEIAARIEKMRQTYRRGTAPPAADDDSLAARVARTMARRRDTSPTAGQEQQGPVPDMVGAPAPNPPEKPVREKDVAGLPDDLPPPGGSTRAQNFLREANRMLQRKALQREVEDALQDIWNGDKWFFALDREDAHLRGSRKDFEKWADTTFRDSKAFLDRYDAQSTREKRMDIKMLRDSPEVFARLLVTPRGPENASDRKHPSGWRATLGKVAKRLSGDTPQRRVFKNVPGFEDDCRLVADAEARYSGALIDHERAYCHFARVLGVEDTAKPAEVREAITTHVERAKVRKAEIIERRDALGRVPSAKELIRSFHRLGLKDRNSVLQQLRAVGKLVPQALKLAVQLAEGPGHERGGRSL